MVAAMTKLDESLEEINEVYYVLPMDAMILFRDFVSVSKIYYAASTFPFLSFILFSRLCRLCNLSICIAVEWLIPISIRIM